MAGNIFHPHTVTLNQLEPQIIFTHCITTHFLAQYILNPQAYPLPQENFKSTMARETKQTPPKKTQPKNYIFPEKHIYILAAIFLKTKIILLLTGNKKNKAVLVVLSPEKIHKFVDPDILTYWELYRAL